MTQVFLDDILSACQSVHEFITGSGPDAFADWAVESGDGTGDLLAVVDALKDRVTGWREPSSEYDLAVKALVVATIDEFYANGAVAKELT